MDVSFFLNRTVHYCLTDNKHFTFPANSLPEQLRSQKQIVELMANYMEQNLMEVSYLGSAIVWCKSLLNV